MEPQYFVMLIYRECRNPESLASGLDSSVVSSGFSPAQGCLKHAVEVWHVLLNVIIMVYVKEPSTSLTTRVNKS